MSHLHQSEAKKGEGERGAGPRREKGVSPPPPPPPPPRLV